MGLANLVPGISGGTMLLATGVYPDFVGAIAEFTTFKFRTRSIVIFGAIFLSAVLAILLFAGPTKELVVTHRWVMYSIFIGLTLGGAPLVWKLAKPVTPSFFVSAIAGFAVMVVMATLQADGASGERNYIVLFVAGVAGASAMILPGVSGGYLLLLMGQYVPILRSIQTLKTGLLGDSDAGISRDFGLVLESMHVVIPVGIGVVIGVVAVSNLIEWLLKRFEKATLGVLFGLLIGAVVGLWPFQEGVQPEIGSTLKGRVVTEERLAEIEPDDWPVKRFSPGGGQVGGAIALILLGFGATMIIDHIGGGEEPAPAVSSNG